MISIFSIDDHKMLVDSFIQHFQYVPDMQVTDYALSGAEAFKKLDPTNMDVNPDVILLDIGLGDMNGVQCAKQLLANNPQLRIIGLSTYMQASIVKKLLKLGAKGYVSKTTDLRQLEVAIRKVVAGEVYLDQNIQKSLLDSILKQKPIPKSTVIPTLTPREKEVLQLIAEEMNSKEIAQALYVSVNTVETHRKNLISKFAVKNSIGLVKKAIEFNLLEH